MKHHYRQFLNQCLTDRKRKNPVYSMRAFARSLDCDPSLFCKILSGTKTLSVPLATKMVTRMGLTDEAKRRFLLSVAKAANDKIVDEASRTLGCESLLPLVDPLPFDIFEKIGRLQVLKVLESASLENADLSPLTLAKRFHITPEEAEAILRGLLDQNLLKEENGRLVKNHRHVIFDFSEHPVELKEYHQELLKESSVALTKFDCDKLGLQSMTMAIDPARIPEAKRMLRDFAIQLSEFLEDGNRTRIYELALQLFPLDDEQVEACTH